MRPSLDWWCCAGAGVPHKARNWAATPSPGHHHQQGTHWPHSPAKSRRWTLWGRVSLFLIILLLQGSWISRASCSEAREEHRSDNGSTAALQHCSTAAGSSAAVYCSNSISQRGKNLDHFIISSLKNASQFKMHLRIANELSRLRRRV